MISMYQCAVEVYTEVCIAFATCLWFKLHAAQ